jgi:hypothetical protein
MRYAVVESFTDWDIGEDVQIVLAVNLTKEQADDIVAKNPAEREAVSMVWLDD